VRIAGQMGGALSNYFYGLTPFGGPEYNMDTDHHSNAEAFLSETESTFFGNPGISCEP
jgi:hypothetical protein